MNTIIAIKYINFNYWLILINEITIYSKLIKNIIRFISISINDVV